MRRANDAYYTPDDLAARLVGLLPLSDGDTVLEPHVGGGAFARALRASGVGALDGCDINLDAAGFEHCDVMRRGCNFLDADVGYDWIIGNPPFKNAEAHVRHALDLAPNVAFLLRLAFLESRARIPFWAEHPAAKVWVLSQRPSFTGGRTDSCAYGWFVWSRTHFGPTQLSVLDWKGGR